MKSLSENIKPSKILGLVLDKEKKKAWSSVLCIEKHCLSEKHVYQKPPVLRLLFITAGNIISQSYYIECLLWTYKCYN